MRTYTVLGTYDVRFTVEAEDADDAERRVYDGDAGNGEIEGASVDKVTSKYEHGRLWDDYGDERTYCQCGHLADQHHAARSVTADDDTQVPVQPCGCYNCGCLAPVVVRTVELPAEDVAS